MNSIEIEVCKALPPKEELSGILSQYYDLAVHRMRDIGFDIPLLLRKARLQSFGPIRTTTCLLMAVLSWREKAREKSSDAVC